MHRIVFNRFDHDNGRFKSELEVLVDKEKADAAAKEAAANKPAFQVPDDIINDWTGTKFVNPKKKED